MSNSLDPDQVQCFVLPDLGPNCLQKISADNTSRQIVNGVGINSGVSIFIDVYPDVSLKGTATLMITMFYMKDLYKP